MELFRRTLFSLTVSLCFIACFDNDFRALNTDKRYNFVYDGLEKELHFSKDKAYALVFFTKDCGVCKEQIAALKELRDYDFDFLGVLADAKDEKDALSWALNYDFDFSLLYERKAGDFLSKAVGGIFGVPVIVFFDKQGKMKEKFIGLTPKSILEKNILASL